MAPKLGMPSCRAAPLRWGGLIFWVVGGYDYGYTRCMKTAISIPDRLFEAAERLAKAMGISRSELYQRAVAELLERHSAELVTRELDAVYRVRPADSGLDPDLARAQEDSLDDRVRDEDDEW